MAIKPLSINDLSWGLNTWSPSTIWNNQFSKLTNFFYNSDWQVETRRGYTAFGDELSAPITSYFFYQNDWTLDRTAVCNSWTAFYQLNSGGTAWVSKKTGLTEFETNSNKTTRRTRRDYAVYKNIIYMCNGVDSYAKWDGTTYTEYAAQPKIRYISYLQDRLYGAWDDTNPNSLYYTAALPSDWNSINTNTLVVWWDENWQINWLTELQSSVLALKSNNIYAINVTASTATPIDSQAWGYADRSIARVADSLVYFSDKGVETLKARTWVTGSNALASKSLSEDVKELLDNITEFNYSAQVWWYSKKANNYYFTFDTNDDNIPDTTLVYSSLTKWRSKYSFPIIYDYWQYITSDQEEKILFASGNSMYEFETGLTDNWNDIEFELETKAYDFDTPGLYKTVDYVDVIGLKNIWSTISVKTIVDDVVVSEWFITDSNIDVTTVYKTLGTSLLWWTPLTGWEDSSWINMYQYSVRLPLYASGNSCAINMSSTGGVWTLHKARISVEQEPIEVFNSNNIL